MINLLHPVFFISLIFFGAIIPKLLIGISSAVSTIEKSKEEIKRRQAENDMNLGREIEDLEKQKQEFKQKNLIRKFRQINKKIRSLQKRKENFQRRSARLIKRYELLNNKDGVLFPAVFVFYAVIYTFLAMKCVDRLAVITSYSFVFFSLSIAFFRVLKCFNIIRDAQAREKAYEKRRITDAFYKKFSWRDEINQT